MPVVAVRAASLDDPGRFVPDHRIFAAAGLAWDWQDPGLTVFEGMPG